MLALKKEDQQLELAERVEKEQLSVRKTEAAVKEMQGREQAIPISEADKPAKPGPPELSNHLKSLQDQLRTSVGVKVEFKLKSADSGQVVLHFANQNDFERILETLQDRSQSKAA